MSWFNSLARKNNAKSQKEQELLRKYWSVAGDAHETVARQQGSNADIRSVANDASFDGSGTLTRSSSSFHHRTNLSEIFEPKTASLTSRHSRPNPPRRTTSVKGDATGYQDDASVAKERARGSSWQPLAPIPPAPLELYANVEGDERSTTRSISTSSPRDPKAPSSIMLDSQSIFEDGGFGLMGVDDGEDVYRTNLQPVARCVSEQMPGNGASARVLDPATIELLELIAHRWFQPALSRTDADAILKSRPSGTYFVRKSDTPGSAYSLSVRASNNMVYHLKLVRRHSTHDSTNGSSSSHHINSSHPPALPPSLGTASLPPYHLEGNRFNDLAALISHYHDNPLPIPGTTSLNLKLEAAVI